MVVEANNIVSSGEADRAEAIRAAIEGGRSQMAQALAGGASGVEVCQRLSSVYDSIVIALWFEALEEVLGADECHLALVALGGWGREEICPYSDIDFVILAEERFADIAKEVADRILYPLWDAKAKVGHAVRSVRDAAALARADLPTATALLDARLVVGSTFTFGELERAARSSIAPGGNANEFVRRLHAEQERRHQRFGDSLYLLEPNIKQGIGGLRDFSTAQWAACARWSVKSVMDLVAIGELTRRQALVMRTSLDFLLKVRSWVQLEAKRGTDQLSFEIQEVIGPALFPDAMPQPGRNVAAVAPGVETLMRQYYLSGRGVQRISGRVLESARVPERRKPRIRKVDRSFLSWNGKLAVSEAAVFKKTPSEMVRYFWVGMREGIPLYGHTKELIEAELAKTGHMLPLDLKASQYFMFVLTDCEDRGDTSMLQEMNSVGILAAMMPAFGACTGRVQHDLYHVYTVDHHQIFTVDFLKRTARGEAGRESRLATECMGGVGNSRTLFLATLLHDVGKPLGAGHAESGARIAARIAENFGFQESEIALVDFLVREHLTMSHISQRRDLSDPDVITKFAKRVSNVERLTQLYLLTRCDTAMTAPGNLSSWKDDLLSELFLRTRELLEGGMEMGSEQALHRRQARQRAVEIISEEGQSLSLAARAEALANRFEPSFVNSLRARQLARVIQCILDREDAALALKIVHHVISGQSQTEIICVSQDEISVLSLVAGVLARHGIHIDSAIATSLSKPSLPAAVQVFFVQDEFQQAISDSDRRWARVLGDLNEVFAAEDSPAKVMEILASKGEKQSYASKAITSAPKASYVKIFDGESSEYSVVEVHTHDAVGVLYGITKTMAEQGVDIHRAMVSTEGDKIADVFYVQKHGQDSKLSLSEGEKLEAAILEALE